MRATLGFVPATELSPIWSDAPVANSLRGSTWRNCLLGTGASPPENCHPRLRTPPIWADSACSRRGLRQLLLRNHVSNS
jgi:hypothetical protein